MNKANEVHPDTIIKHKWQSITKQLKEKKRFYVTKYGYSLFEI